MLNIDYLFDLQYPSLVPVVCLPRAAHCRLLHCARRSTHGPPDARQSISVSWGTVDTVEGTVVNDTVRQEYGRAIPVPGK